MNKQVINSEMPSSINKPRRHSMFFPVSLVISLVGLVFSFIAFFPGGMSPDSFDMWGMGWKWPWNDWHSTYISLLMNASRQLRDDPAIYLFFQLLLLWGGLYFFSAALRKTVGNWALLVPLLGFTPMFLGLSGYLHKTPLQVAIFIFVFSIIYLHHSWGSRMPGMWVMALLILFFIGMPLRRFGYITAIPLLIYFQYIVFSSVSFGALVKYFMGSFVIIVASLFMYNLITYDILNVEKRYKIQTLYKFDLAAIYALTGVNYAPGLTKKEFMRYEFARKEYEKQNGLWRIVDIYKRVVDPVDVAVYRNAWLKAIRNHPYVWLDHKAHSFSVSLGFGIKMKGAFRGADYYKSQNNVFELKKSKNLLYDLVDSTYKSSILKDCLCIKPWFWMIITYVMLFLSIVLWILFRRLRDALLPHIVLLVSAGLFYPMFFLISLNKDMRFTYWAITSTALATLSILLYLASWKVQGYRSLKSR